VTASHVLLCVLSALVVVPTDCVCFGFVVQRPGGVAAAVTAHLMTMNDGELAGLYVPLVPDHIHAEAICPQQVVNFKLLDAQKLWRLALHESLVAVLVVTQLVNHVSLGEQVAYGAEDVTSHVQLFAKSTVAWVFLEATDAVTVQEVPIDKDGVCALVKPILQGCCQGRYVVVGHVDVRQQKYSAALFGHRVRLVVYLV